MKINNTIISIINKILNTNKKYIAITSGGIEDINGKNEMFSNWEMKKTNKPIKDNGKSKIFISRLLKRNKKHRTLVCHFDNNGTKLIQEDSYFLSNNKNLKWILSESNIFKFISGLMAKSQYLSPTLLNNIPKMENFISTNNKDLYKHFNLTQEEIQYIEDNI